MVFLQRPIVHLVLYHLVHPVRLLTLIRKSQTLMKITLGKIMKVQVPFINLTLNMYSLVHIILIHLFLFTWCSFSPHRWRHFRPIQWLCFDGFCISLPPCLACHWHGGGYAKIIQNLPLLYITTRVIFYKHCMTLGRRALVLPPLGHLWWGGHTFIHPSTRIKLGICNLGLHVHIPPPPHLARQGHGGGYAQNPLTYTPFFYFENWGTRGHACITRPATGTKAGA